MGWSLLASTVFDQTNGPVLTSVCNVNGTSYGCDGSDIYGISSAGVLTDLYAGVFSGTVGAIMQYTTTRILGINSGYQVIIGNLDGTSQANYKRTQGTTMGTYVIDSTHILAVKYLSSQTSLQKYTLAGTGTLNLTPTSSINVAGGAGGMCAFNGGGYIYADGSANALLNQTASTFDSIVATFDLTSLGITDTFLSISLVDGTTDTYWLCGNLGLYKVKYSTGSTPASLKHRLQQEANQIRHLTQI